MPSESYFFQNHSFCDFYNHKLLNHLLEPFTYPMKILTERFINIKMAAVVLGENWFMFDDLTELIKTGEKINIMFHLVKLLTFFQT